MQTQRDDTRQQQFQSGRQSGQPAWRGPDQNQWVVQDQYAEGGTGQQEEGEEGEEGEEQQRPQFPPGKRGARERIRWERQQLQQRREERQTKRETSRQEQLEAHRGGGPLREEELEGGEEEAQDEVRGEEKVEEGEEDQGQGTQDAGATGKREVLKRVRDHAGRLIETVRERSGQVYKTVRDSSGELISRVRQSTPVQTVSGLKDRAENLAQETLQKQPVLKAIHDVVQSKIAAISDASNPSAPGGSLEGAMTGLGDRLGQSLLNKLVPGADLKEGSVMAGVRSNVIQAVLSMIKQQIGEFAGTAGPQGRVAIAMMVTMVLTQAVFAARKMMRIRQEKYEAREARLKEKQENVSKRKEERIARARSERESRRTPRSNRPGKSLDGSWGSAWWGWGY